MLMNTIFKNTYQVRVRHNNYASIRNSENDLLKFLHLGGWFQKYNFHVYGIPNEGGECFQKVLHLFGQGLCPELPSGLQINGSSKKKNK